MSCASGSSVRTSESSVRLEREIEEMSQEILERYEEVNLLYRLSDSFRDMFDERQILGSLLAESARAVRALALRAPPVADLPRQRMGALGVAGQESHRGGVDEREGVGPRQAGRLQIPLGRLPGQGRPPRGVRFPLELVLEQSPAQADDLNPEARGHVRDGRAVGPGHGVPPVNARRIRAVARR